MLGARRFGWALVGWALAATMVPCRGLAAAPAGEVGPVALPPLILEGDLPPKSVERLQKRLLDGMADASFEVIGPEPVVRAHRGATQCTSPACIQAVASATGTDTVLRTTVRFEHRDYELMGELMAADGVTVLVRAEDQCDLCGIEEAGDLLAGLAMSIRRKLDADARARPLLNVTTAPAGATVFVDGVVVGTSPVELDLAPGAHDIRVEKAGFAPRERKLELVQGVHESVSLELSVSARRAADPSNTDKGLAPWVGWSVLGGGGALTLTGVTLLAFHTQPVRRKCTGSNVDMDGTCRFNHDTIVPGTILGAAGLALVGTGIALVVRQHKRSASVAKVALAPGPRGIAIRF